jgi:hypothetical protein
MSIETRCGGCGKLLRVADEFAGRQARCPQCGFIYIVPVAGGPVAAASSQPHFAAQLTGDSDGPWWMRTPEGQTYGPVPREKLDVWVREGRVTDDCHLRQGDQGAWLAASVIYPALAQPRGRATPSSPMGPAQHGQSYGPLQQHAVAGSYAPQAAATPYGFREPHRGGLILTLGILGWVVSCPIFSAIAWGMGSTDMPKLRSGQMDPEGLGMTQAGQIMGMVQCILWLVGAGLLLLAMVCGVLADR